MLVTAYKDKSFEFVRAASGALRPIHSSDKRPSSLLQVVKNPPATYFIKKAAGASRRLPERLPRACR